MSSGGSKAVTVSSKGGRPGACRRRTEPTPLRSVSPSRSRSMRARRRRPAARARTGGRTGRPRGGRSPAGHGRDGRAWRGSMPRAGLPGDAPHGPAGVGPAVSPRPARPSPHPCDAEPRAACGPNEGRSPGAHAGLRDSGPLVLLTGGRAPWGGRPQLCTARRRRTRGTGRRARRGRSRHPPGPRLGSAGRMARIPTNISDHIGKTPMVRLTRLEPEGVELYGKLEAYNPGGVGQGPHRRSR